jgi:non-ribosomal peptide synthetase component F
MRRCPRGGRTPSDLPLVALTQTEIEQLEREYPQIEDILPLSPLQEGLLFHALYDAQAPDIYTVQLSSASQVRSTARHCTLARALILRHASLRASFRQERLSRPVQLIVPRETLPWRRVDLSMLDEKNQAERVARVLVEECAERFDLSVPPLLRLALIRLAPDRHRLVLTNHHILLDGWSTPILVQELLTLYAQRLDVRQLGDVLPPATPYRDYLAWIAAQDREAAVAAWREHLGGLDETTRVVVPDAEGVPVVPDEVTLALTETLTTALNFQARRQGVTLNTLIQAAWAILLGRLTGRNDVVFGITVAGRPPELAGIERMVGLFINTLPLRVKLPPGKSLRELLADVQESQSRLMAHQYLDLAEILGLVGLGKLFDTLVVFESYPVDRERLAADAGGLQLTDIGGIDATHYPLSLAATPGERLQLRLSYRADLFERETVEVTVARLVRLLELAAADANRAIGPFDILTPEERLTILREWNDTARAIPPATFPSCSPPKPGERPMPSRWRLATRASPTASSMRIRASWRVTCAGSGSGPRWWWGCASSAPGDADGLIGILGRRRLSAARPGLSARASASCWRIPARRCWSPDPRCWRLAQAPCRIVCLDADWATIARQLPPLRPAASGRKTRPM